MGISSYLSIAKWVAVVGLVSALLYEVQLSGKLKAEKKAWIEERAQLEADNGNMAKRLERVQNADRKARQEAEQYRSELDRTMRALENAQGNADFDFCRGVSIPAAVVDGLRQQATSAGAVGVSD